MSEYDGSAGEARRVIRLGGAPRSKFARHDVGEAIRERLPGGRVDAKKLERDWQLSLVIERLVNDSVRSRAEPIPNGKAGGARELVRKTGVGSAVGELILGSSVTHGGRPGAYQRETRA